MSLLFPPGPFVDFGPSAYVLTAAPECFRIAPCKPAKLRAQVRLLAPRRAGVYGMLDRHHELIYVGKAKNLRARLLSYFRPRSRPRKAAGIVRHAVSVLWESCPSEFASLLRELELIRRWRPRCNVQGQPLRRRQTYLCVGRAPAAYAFLAADPPRTARAIFGPIPADRRAHDAVRRLNDAFQLRDCPQAIDMIFPDQGDLFNAIREPGCLRMDLGTCLGPCTGRCTRDAYQTQVQRARAFLVGKEAGPIPGLLRQMEQAATALDFERAAGLRDRLTPLQWLATKLERLRHARERLSFVYPVAGVWYLIHGARTMMAVGAPTDADGRERALAAIHAVFGDGYAGSVHHGRGSLREAYEHADGMSVVAAWFRKRPEELRRTLTAEQARLFCAGENANPQAGAPLAG